MIDDAWVRFIKFTESEHWRWAVFFEGQGRVTIEYFGDGYLGDPERGTGTWRVMGKLDDAINKAIRRRNGEAEVEEA